MVTIVGRLVGRALLDANAEKATVVTAFRGTRQPPLSELDQIVASVLASRFSLPDRAAA